MSQSASQATAFYHEVAKNQKVFTVRDSGGFPAPINAEGKRSLPLWSSSEKVKKIIKTIPAYKGFEIFEISWKDFCKDWIPNLIKDNLLIGVNWSGKKATGYDIEPEAVKKSVESFIDSKNN